MSILKKLLLVPLAMLLALYSFAQAVTVTGKVTDKPTGEGLPGVTILVKGTTNGTITDIDGNYSIPAKIGDILIFSYIGFFSKEVKVESTEINVQLEEDAVTFDEMVVIGYGNRSNPPSYTPVEDDNYLSEHPGQLTCSEWNDLGSWSFFKSLWSSYEFTKMQNSRGFKPEERYTVTVKTVKKKPIAGATVELLNGSRTIWKAVTNNNGNAELWANAVGENEQASSYTIRATVNGVQAEAKAKKYSKGKNVFKLAVQPTTKRQADVLMVVDATGSMGDEMEFIKSELNDVLTRVKKKQADLSLRTGAVYYRDHGDEFVTKMSPLTDNVQHTLNFIEKQRADGGGDFPEAVDSALHDAIYNLQWNNDAVARLLFLVLDAPPHQNDEVNANLQRQIKDAAAMGITIIPVVASGIEKENEFLFRSWAVLTNGTYVFITDHSGIGNEHLEASVGDYKVELLNDALVRIILKYTKQ